MKLFLIFISIQIIFSYEIFSAENLKTKKKVQMNSSLKYGEIVKFKVGEELQFQDFKITYINDEDPEENAEIKTTSDIHIRHFVLKDNKGEHKFEIYHGQLPPDPKELKLDSGLFVIHTFKTPKGVSLFPDNLFIVKKH